MNKWIKCTKASNIAALWANTTLEADFPEDKYELLKVYTVKGNFIQSDKPGKYFEAPLEMPLSKINDGMTVWYVIENVVERECLTISTKPPQKNAFDVLMSKKNSIPISPKNVSNSKDELFNDIINLVGNAEFPPESTANINRLVKTLCEALWAIDGNHHHFNKAFANKNCMQLPSYFFKIYDKAYFD